MTFKAVIFDIGGVVVGSPLFAINRYEKEHGLPCDYLNVAITSQGHGGAFQQFERRELDIYTFYRRFGEELSNVEKNNEAYIKFCKSRGQEVPKLPTKLNVDGRELFGRMMKQLTKVDPKMRNAIMRLKAPSLERENRIQSSTSTHWIFSRCKRRKSCSWTISDRTSNLRKSWASRQSLLDDGSPPSAKL
ncbi:hypothetical protein [Sporisorium scitamineum]|uniref:Uncharacterized protein n=1 Tax=Sporisorium scitamineum TaxID=49012 RepID=A0A0F7SA41_9BASI|nr:hypothetical protein [Sporisorium scitamineum]